MTDKQDSPDMREKIEQAWWEVDANTEEARRLMPTPKEHKNLFGDKEKYLKPILALYTSEKEKDKIRWVKAGKVLGAKKELERIIGFLDLMTWVFNPKKERAEFLGIIKELKSGLWEDYLAPKGEPC